MPEHLSIFLENKPGKLDKVVELLAAASVNIRAFAIAGSGKFGVLKMLVDDIAKAASALSSAGFAIARRPIIAVLVSDSPGSFHQLLKGLSSDGVNVSDSYGFILDSGNSAVIVIECENIEEAAASIARQGLKTLSEAGLAKL